MDKIDADAAEREGLSVADHRERIKKRQGRMRDFDKEKVERDDGTTTTRRRKFIDDVEEIEAQAKAARRGGRQRKVD